jgi:hypothetical protein
MICRLSTTGMPQHPNATALAQDALAGRSGRHQPDDGLVMGEWLARGGGSGPR